VDKVIAGQPNSLAARASKPPWCYSKPCDMPASLLPDGFCIQGCNPPVCSPKAASNKESVQQIVLGPGSSYRPANKDIVSNSGLCGPAAIGPPGPPGSGPYPPSSCSATLKSAGIPEAGPQVMVSGMQLPRTFYFFMGKNSGVSSIWRVLRQQNKTPPEYSRTPKYLNRQC
jgi:hypothetical protein